MTRHSGVRRFAVHFLAAVAAVLGLSFLAPDEVSEAQTSFTCTQVIGYSQTNQWFFGAQAIAGDSRWQLLYNDGGATWRWSDPSYSGWGNPKVSPCTSGSSTPDRVIVDVTRNEYQSNVAVHEDDVRDVVNTIRLKYPSVRQILLQPVVGGPNETRCFWNGAPFNAVRASYNHPYIQQAIGRVVGGAALRGFDPHVRTCADYVDDVGHLSAAAADAIGRSIGTFYASSPPPPPTATATRTPTVTAIRTPTPGPSATATPTPPVGGSAGKFSVRFNGSTSSAEAPNATELNPQGGWTVEAWFKDAHSAGYDHLRGRILTKGDPYALPDVPYALSIASGDLGVVMKTNNQYVVLSYNLPTHGVIPNAWHHVAATFDSGTRRLTLYLDGVAVTSGTSPVGTGNNIAPVTIGADGAPGACCYWDGGIDDVRIWTVARTEAQIQSNFRTQLEGTQIGLAANWKFDEGTGQTANDSAGSPQTATLGNVAWSTNVHP